MSRESETTGAQFYAPGFPQTDGVSFNNSVNSGALGRWRVEARQPIISRDRLARSRRLELSGDAARRTFRYTIQELVRTRGDLELTIRRTVDHTMAGLGKVNQTELGGYGQIRRIQMAKCARANHLFAISTAVLLFVNGSVIAQTQQQHVHDMSHGVMPFDVAKTVHIFEMTESGGVERVVVKDKSDADQVVLIQQHLRQEAARFQRGDYSEPAMLHGVDMPGLKELQLGAKGVKVSYSELAHGAEIAFKTADPHLLTAIHRWFGAQLSEHGADARPE